MHFVTMTQYAFFADISGVSAFPAGGPGSFGSPAIALAAGFGLMPVLIYLLGSSLLGRYEGASLRRTFESIYAGVQSRVGGLLDRPIRALWPISHFSSFAAPVARQRQAGLIGSPNGRLSYFERGR